MRYVIAFTATMLLVSGLRLATGQEPRLLDALTGLAVVIVVFMGRRIRNRTSGMLQREGLICASFGLLFSLTVLVVETYRIFQAFATGMLLVSTSPAGYVTWQDKPIGFVVAALTHLAIMAILAFLIWGCSHEISQRRGSRSDPTGSS
ncbi:MAG: hypothetical protein P0Y59_23185 [Candidatus Sphingomonas phytovorans]|nr:hypothetical protein [Sphingomonas sp.]WEJ99772.1 MAG: hypothetical protein P0Y59_23185 [Sphingomonas sp.]